MIFSATTKTINGKPSALCKSGLIIDSEPAMHPFLVGNDSEYILNKARNWLESYDNRGYNNHLNIDCFYLFSVNYECSPNEYYYLLSFEGRNNDESCVIMKAIHEDLSDDFDLDYFSLIGKNSYTERMIGSAEFNTAVRAFFFAKTEMNLSSFYEFTQHPNFDESVAMYNLLNF